MNRASQAQAYAGPGSEHDYETVAATAAEAWAALRREGSSADAVRSYLGPDGPRYDTPEARAEAKSELEAGQ